MLRPCAAEPSNGQGRRDIGMSGRTFRVFISYAHEDSEFRQELQKHLSSLVRCGLITTWHDRQIRPGQAWETEIDRNLNSADMVVLLVSADFLHSEYCNGKEMERAFE